MGTILLASLTGAFLGYLAGRCRSFDPWLAVLAIASSGCAGGAPNGVPFPMPSPVVAAPRDAARPVTAKRAGTAAARVPSASSKKAAPKPAAPKPAARAVQRPSTVAPAAKARIDSTALEFAVTARLAHAPLARAIARRTRNPVLAERAAWAVTREAGRLRMSPSLLAAVLLEENRQLDSAAVSSAGAIGLMQVMPFHAGSYGCPSADLATVDGNICHGASVLHLYLKRTRSVAVALRRYNGCVRGTNTPRCERYPVRVLRTAARLRRDVLASAPPVDQRVRM